MLILYSLVSSCGLWFVCCYFIGHNPAWENDTKTLTSHTCLTVFSIKNMSLALDVLLQLITNHILNCAFRLEVNHVHANTPQSDSESLLNLSRCHNYRSKWLIANIAFPFYHMIKQAKVNTCTLWISLQHPYSHSSIMIQLVSKCSVQYSMLS